MSEGERERERESMGTDAEKKWISNIIKDKHKWRPIIWVSLTLDFGNKDIYRLSHQGISAMPQRSRLFPSIGRKPSVPLASSSEADESSKSANYQQHCTNHRTTCPRV